VVQTFTQSDAFKDLRRPPTALCPWQARNPHRHFDVLGGVKLRQEVVKLKDESDVPVPKGDPLRIGHPRQGGIPDPDGSCIGLIEPAKDMEQRALADTGRSDDREHLPGGHLELEIA
jgi:hypothetical protein